MSEKLTPLNVGELGLRQSMLKVSLHNNIRAYLNYRIAKSNGLKMKAPISLTTLAKQQAEINRIRVKLGHQRIRLIQDLKKVIKHY